MGNRACERLLLSSSAISIDGLLEACGGFGRMQGLTTACAFTFLIVHGAQVMSMAYLGPAAAAEYESEGAVMRLSGSFFFVGWLAGLPLWGRLAARRGWLSALSCMELCVVVFGCGSALATSGRAYLASRLLVGFAQGGVPTTTSGWAAEFVLPADRTFCGLVLNLGFVSGSLLVTALSYWFGLEQWRALSAGIALGALPLALAAAFALLESPRWLLRAGRAAQSAEVLRAVARRNGRTSALDDEVSTLEEAAALVASDGSPTSSCGEPPAPALAQRKATKPSLLALVISDGAVRWILGILALQWFSYSALYFGLMLHDAHDLRGMLRTAALQIPGALATAWSFDRLGRRTTTCVLLLLGGALPCAGLAVLAAHPHTEQLGSGAEGAHAHAPHAAAAAHPHLHAALTSLGCVCMSAAFGMGFVYTGELLPTELRAVGLAACSFVARLGGFCSPLLLLLSEAAPAACYVLWACIALAAAAATLRLPETRGEPTLETVDDLRRQAAKSRT